MSGSLGSKVELTTRPPVTLSERSDSWISKAVCEDAVSLPAPSVKKTASSTARAATKVRYKNVKRLPLDLHIKYLTPLPLRGGANVAAVNWSIVGEVMR